MNLNRQGTCGKRDFCFSPQGIFMKIEKVLTSQGMAGYYNKDLAAIKAGARPDGFVFRDPPITPGFHAVTRPGEALSDYAPFK